MAGEMTPRNWPSESRGIVDNVAEAVRTRMGIGAAVKRIAARFAPWGRMAASLTRGQAVSLDGPRMARVECLEGTAWVTCPSDGRDLRLRAGESAVMRGPGRVVVSAAGGPASIRLGWK